VLEDLPRDALVGDEGGNRQLAQQAQTLAYADVIFVFACFAAAMVPLVFLTRRSAAAPAMGH
jgi:hypothetical protein